MKKILLSVLFSHLLITARNGEQFVNVDQGVFPNAHVEQAALINAPRAEDFHFHQEPERKIVTNIHTSDSSAKAIAVDALKNFIATIFQLMGRDVYESVKQQIIPDEEQAMQKAVAELQIRQANLQMQEQEQQTKLITELNELVSIVRKLNEKAASEKLTSAETTQLEDAKQSLQLLQTIMQQIQN